MIKKLLACLEGSPSGDTALRIALALARECDAPLSGLALVDAPDIQAGAITSIGGSTYKQSRDRALLAEARTQADKWLAQFQRRCRAAQVACQPIQVEGKPVATIVSELQHHDLTVIGRDANFRYSTRPEDEETREAILHRAPRPVLIVPDDPGANCLGSTVVVAYDGSGAARRAMLSFAASGLARSRDVHVVTVDEMGESAWKMANSGVQILRTAGVDATLHNLVSPRSNTDALLEHSKKLGAGVIVMGAFARSRLAELFTHSTTLGLVEKSPIPLYMQH